MKKNLHLPNHHAGEEPTPTTMLPDCTVLTVPRDSLCQAGLTLDELKLYCSYFQRHHLFLCNLSAAKPPQSPYQLARHRWKQNQSTYVPFCTIG